MATTKTTKARLAEVNASFPRFAEECIRIQTENEGLQPFVLRSIQRQIVANVLFGDEFLVRRWMVLKPRQIGATTLHWALSFWLALTRKDHQALIIAHEEDLAADILQRVRLAYDNLPEWYPKPKLGRDSQAALSFPENRSAIYIGTAGTGKKGSSAKLGRTYQSIYATELADAKWEEIVIKRLLQCAHEFAIVMLDSTANGAMGWWYDEWGKAGEKKSNFVPYFFKWKQHEEYRRDPGKKFERTPEEEILAQAEDLDNSQLAWRRWKLNEISEEDFAELYPTNDIDCFLQSGSPCFNPRDLQFMLTSTEFANGWPTLRGNLRRMVPQRGA